MKKMGLIALTPILVFLGVYLVTSILIKDFYKVPVASAFLLASVYAVLISKGTLRKRLDLFSEGAGNPRILLMVWIFILAGAFAQTAKDIGAIDATVNLTLRVIPGSMLFAGLFFTACFISMSVGTSVGTIVALVPIATGIAQEAGFSEAFMAAIIVGGAFFGDNLSFISDTTIVATQTQGCKLSDKFRFNIVMVIPAALIVAVLYVFLGTSATDGSFSSFTFHLSSFPKVLPYLAVLVTAAFGVNVLVVLALGCALTCLTGILDGSYTLMGWIDSSLTGVMGMSELILISMLAGGIFALISHNGGMEFVIDRITRRVRSRKGAEWSICALVAFANVCTANNTIAILSVGDITRRIAEQFDIDPRRSASLLDTTSCCVQGILPYGAQLLMASGLAGISAMSIVPYLFYPALLGITVAATIVFSKRC